MKGWKKCSSCSAHYNPAVYPVNHNCPPFLKGNHMAKKPIILMEKRIKSSGKGKGIVR